ncbi:MAG TPA: hypothetical protein VNI20_04325 [Fimbriimonadaceae bacterium]|nr:hypothetical protein [Fimbriimonadaceae bacterium]
MLTAIGLLLVSGVSPAQPAPPQHWYDNLLPATSKNKTAPPADGTKNINFNWDFGAGSSKCRLEITYKSIDTRKFWYSTLSCYRWCKGSKPMKHSECDDSCDYFEHCSHWQKSLDASIQDYYGKGALPTIVDGASYYNDYNLRALGACVSWQAMKGWSDNLSKYSIPVSDKHWNKTPCTLGDLYYAFRIYDVRADYKLYVESVGTHKEELQAHGGGIVCTVYVPEPGPFARKLSLNCSCSHTGLTEGNVELLWPEYKPQPNKPKPTKPQPPTNSEQANNTSMNYGNAFTESGEFVSMQNLGSEYNMNVACTDMNHAQLTFQPRQDVSENVSLYAGQVYVPADGDYQSVGLIDNIRTTFSFGSELHGPWAPETKTYDAHVLCLNMHKKEPAAGVKYTQGRMPAPEVGRLLAYSAKSMFRGPWDQIRVWIATDHATYDEAAKVLVPMVSASMYVQCLRDDEEIGGVRLDAPEYLDCMNPRLLAAKDLSVENAAWLAGHLATSKAKKTADWIRGNASRLAAQSPKVISAELPILAAKGDEKSKITLLQCLPKVVKDPQSCDLEGVYRLVLDDNPAVARAALKAIKAIRPPSAKLWVALADGAKIGN